MLAWLVASPVWAARQAYVWQRTACRRPCENELTGQDQCTPQRGAKPPDAGRTPQHQFCNNSCYLCVRSQLHTCVPYTHVTCGYLQHSQHEMTLTRGIAGHPCVLRVLCDTHSKALACTSRIFQSGWRVGLAAVSGRMLCCCVWWCLCSFVGAVGLLPAIPPSMRRLLAYLLLQCRCAYASMGRVTYCLA